MLKGIQHIFNLPHYHILKTIVYISININSPSKVNFHYKKGIKPLESYAVYLTKVRDYLSEYETY